MRFAIIDGNSLKVINVCEWEGAEWLPPFGTFVAQADRAAVNDIYDPVSNSFTRPAEPVVDPVEEPV